MNRAQDVYLEAKRRVGTTAKRGDDPEIALSDPDDDVLEVYLRDALREVATVTDRLTATLQMTTTPGQAYVRLPPHVDEIEHVDVVDGEAAHGLALNDGATVAAKARRPSTKEARPEAMGAHSGRLWLVPIPDQEYTLEIQALLNGEAPRSAYADGLRPPEPQMDSTSVTGFALTVTFTPRSILDEVVAAVPPELERALTAYLLAEWYADNAEGGLSERHMQRFRDDTRRHSGQTNAQRTTTRDYNPLGL